MTSPTAKILTSLSVERNARRLTIGLPIISKQPILQISSFKRFDTSIVFFASETYPSIPFA
jgi:hypothetical protein